MVFRLVVGVLQANCYVVYDGSDSRAVVIDPGDEGQRIAEFIEANALKLEYILNTHYHFDHTGANAYLKKRFGVPIAIGLKDAPYLKEAHRAAWEFMINVEPSPEADILLTDGDVINLGGISLKVIETPGHTPGSVCFYNEVSGELFSGDTLFFNSVGRWDLPGGDKKELMKSLKRLMELPGDTIVYPGHGIETTIKYEKEHNPFITGYGYA